MADRPQSRTSNGPLSLSEFVVFLFRLKKVSVGLAPTDRATRRRRRRKNVEGGVVVVVREQEKGKSRSNAQLPMIWGRFQIWSWPLSLRGGKFENPTVLFSCRRKLFVTLGTSKGYLRASWRASYPMAHAISVPLSTLTWLFAVMSIILVRYRQQNKNASDDSPTNFIQTDRPINNTKKKQKAKTSQRLMEKSAKLRDFISFSFLNSALLILDFGLPVLLSHFFLRQKQITETFKDKRRLNGTFPRPYSNLPPKRPWQCHLACSCTNLQGPALCSFPACTAFSTKRNGKRKKKVKLIANVAQF